MLIRFESIASRADSSTTSNAFGANLQDSTYGMMRLMASVIEQTADLYNAMPKHIPSILEEDPALPRHQEDSQFSEPNRITAKQPSFYGKADAGVKLVVSRLDESG